MNMTPFGLYKHRDLDIQVKVIQVTTNHFTERVDVIFTRLDSEDKPLDLEEKLFHTLYEKV